MRKQKPVDVNRVKIMLRPIEVKVDSYEIKYR